MNSFLYLFLGITIGIIASSLFFIKQIKSLSDTNNSLKEENIKLSMNISTFENLQEVIRKDFVELANQTIKSEQEDLRKQNRESLEEKILPFSKELSAFRDKIEKFNISGVENTTKIVEQIGNLEKNNKIIEKETQNLVNALTKNQNVKGAYGESLLDNILQNIGMVEGIHYSKQLVTNSISDKDSSEHTIRPDIVLNLPDGHNLVIDSKVTLSSYLDYIEDNSKLKTFKIEVKKRIQDLSDKNYQNADKLSQPDFVLMYMPIENSVNLLYEDSDFINFAYKSNVIIVGTSALLTTLRLVNYLMSLQNQNENVKQIVKSGTDLYETFVSFCDDLIELQKRFDDVNLKLGTTINRFRRGNNNKLSLFKQVEQLKNLGINTNKQIDEKFLSENA